MVFDTSALDDLKGSSKKPEICWHHSCRALPTSKATFRPSPTRWFFSPSGLTISNRPTVHFPPRWLQVTDPGPMTLCRWMRIGIQDGSEILTQVQMMIMHEAPLSCGFVANNATVACPHGLERHSRQTTNRKESIAKEKPHQLESYLLQDQIVQILCQDSRTTACRIQTTAQCVTLPAANLDSFFVLYPNLQKIFLHIPLRPPSCPPPFPFLEKRTAQCHPRVSSRKSGECPPVPYF